jgi:N,N'-diacetyllegionaminate synthase
LTYVIAEIGNNHNGSLEKAKDLVLAASETGVDAIKTQSFRGLDIVSPKVLTSDYPDWDTGGFTYWYEFAESVALDLNEHQDLIDYTRSLGLDFITTPVAPSIVDELEKLEGISSYKVASMDLDNLTLLDSMSRTNKPVIMSTGMGSIEEVVTAASYFDRSRLSILHCVSDYPLNPDDAALGNIEFLKDKFNDARIGFSDHSMGHELSIAAISMGAEVIEKHFTLDRTDPSPAEHHMSLEPAEFKTLVTWIRHIDKNIATKGWSRSQIEQKSKSGFRRSFHYKTAMKAGSRISLEDLVFVRPESGINHDQIESVLGRQLTSDKEAYAPCLLQDFN